MQYFYISSFIQYSDTCSFFISSKPHTSISAQFCTPFRTDYAQFMGKIPVLQIPFWSPFENTRWQHRRCSNYSQHPSQSFHTVLWTHWLIMLYKTRPPFRSVLGRQWMMLLCLPKQSSQECLGNAAALINNITFSKPLKISPTGVAFSPVQSKASHSHHLSVLCMPAIGAFFSKSSLREHMRLESIWVCYN